MSKTKNIVVIGGGTGTYTALLGLKKYPVDLTAVVSMADDGGSNRVIRDEFGLLPTSDIRQCFVALAEENGNSEMLLRELFTYRFRQGNGLKGMTFGNLFMAALTDILGSQIKAIEKTGRILKIKGRVLPVTLMDSKLVAVYENGQEVVGEHFIDEPQHDPTLRIEKIFLRPEGEAYPEALRAIAEADFVVLGPGDLYTSLIANLVVKGIVEALRKTKAKIVYVSNLMTRPGQTHGFTARDHVAALEKYLGKNCLDFVIINSQPVPKRILAKYQGVQSRVVQDDLTKSYFKIIRADILGKEPIGKQEGDELQRSFVRHDPDALAKVICKL
ncbi:MAG TPA: gluconeogenesis factor YvcK family protein [Candidatus Paceibacterota bacterium]